MSVSPESVSTWGCRARENASPPSSAGTFSEASSSLQSRDPVTKQDRGQCKPRRRARSNTGSKTHSALQQSNISTGDSSKFRLAESLHLLRYKQVADTSTTSYNVYQSNAQHPPTFSICMSGDVYTPHNTRWEELKLILQHSIQTLCCASSSANHSDPTKFK